MSPDKWRHVEDLYNSALECGPEQQADLLARVDWDVRREVEALLAQPSKGELLDRLPSTFIDPSPCLTVGTEVGPYRLEAQIGEGGMGVVFRARDTKLNRPVAIKFLSDQLADAAARRRFQREAQMASSLNHPHILTVHDAGEFRGRQYLVTEYIDGGTLKDWAQAKPRSWREIVELMVGIADALALAHEASILHRDVKPANILITKTGYAKLADFGLAKLSDVSSAEGATRTLSEHGTRPGVVIGTIAYMSPEQASARPLDERTDMFSFGSVLYELLAGQRPFAGATDLETLQKVIHAPAPPLKESVPQSLRLLVEKMLAKDPADRFPSMREVVAEMRSLRTSAESTAPPPGLVLPASTSSRLTRRQAIAGGSLGVAAVVAAGAYLWRGRSPQFESVAVLPLANATGDPENDYLCEGISENIINRLSATSLKVPARTTAFRLKDSDPITAGKMLNVAAVVTGKITRQGSSLTVQAELINVADGTQIWGDKFVRPLEELQLFEQEMSRTIAENLRVRLTKTQDTQLAKGDTANSEAYKLYLQGQFYWNKYTLEGFQKAIESFKAAIALDPGYAKAYSGLANSYAISVAEGLTDPKENMPQAKSAALRALALNDALADAHTSLGIVALFYEWDWAVARKELERAMELDPVSSNVRHFYGHYLEATGQTDKAISVMKRAVDLDPLSLVINSEYAFTYYCARRFDEAAQLHWKTYEMDRSFFLAAVCWAADIERLNRAPEAVQVLEKAGDNAFILPELAAAYAASGQREKAKAILTRLQRDDAFVDGFLMATSYAELRDTETAFYWLEKAYAARSANFFLLNVEAKLDPLRSDPRFTKLRQRVGL